jgi:hypothetical protein
MEIGRFDVKLRMSCSEKNISSLGNASGSSSVEDGRLATNSSLAEISEFLVIMYPIFFMALTEKPSWLDKIAKDAQTSRTRTSRKNSHFSHTGLP